MAPKDSERGLFGPSVQQDTPDLALEPRIMFDAAAAADIADDVVFAADAAPELPEILGLAPQDAAAQDRAVYVVDMSLPDAEGLIAGLPAEAQVVRIDPGEDGISALAQALDGQTDIDALHILSHGEDGLLYLGGSAVTTASLLGSQGADWAQIGSALSADADILIYGCDFAAGTDGVQAAQALAALTGADVAASDDLTGAQRLGADWDLEVTTGAIEAAALTLDGYDRTLAVDATDGILTVRDCDNPEVTINLTDDGGSLSTTNTGTPRGVAHMVERVWRYGEGGDAGEQTLVLDISGMSGTLGSIASDFALIQSTAADLSADPLVLRASGYDAANGLVFFHGVNISGGTYVGLATQTETDNISIDPVVVVDEEQNANLNLVVQPDLTDGGSLPDTFATAVGYKAEGSTIPTEFLIPAGTTNITVTAYSNEPGNTSGNDARNDDYATMDVAIDLGTQSSGGSIAYIVDQGPNRNDQFGWTDVPLGNPVLSGTVDGNLGSNINPVFAIKDGVLQITENHGLQTSYLVEFQTTLNSSANFLGSAAGLADIGDTSDIVITIPAGVDVIKINQTDAAAGSHSAIEYKGFSKHYIDLATGIGSGTTMAQLGETDARVSAFGYEDYAAGSGDILGNAGVVTGDTGSTVGAVNNLSYTISGNQLIISRDAAFAAQYNSMFTVEFYEQVDLGSSASAMGVASDEAFFDASPGTAEAEMSFDVPEGAKLGIFNMSMGGTSNSNENENTGGAFAIIDLENGSTSGNIFFVRVSNRVDLVSWESVPFGTTMFDVSTGDANGGEATSNHSSESRFNDKFAANARFELVTNADGSQTVQMFTNSSDGNQSWRDYSAFAQVQWLGSEPIGLSGIPTGGSFNIGALDPVTGEWNIDIQEAADQGLIFTPPEHFSGELSLGLNVSVGPETEETLILQRPVIDPILFETDQVIGNEDEAIAIPALVVPTLEDDDGSETITATRVTGLTVGHTLSDGVNSFTANAGSTAVDISDWDLNALTYQAGPQENGDFTFTVNVDYQDTGAGQTVTSSASDLALVRVLPLNDPPEALDDAYSTDTGTTIVLPVLDNDTDPEGDTLTIVAFTQPSNGTVTQTATGFDFVPSGVGVSSFTYTVSDGNGGSETATVTLTVTAAPPDAPIAADDSYSTAEDTALVIAAGTGVNANDTVNSAALTLGSGADAPQNGDVVLNPDGSFTYTPDPDFHGTDSFKYTLTNVTGSAMATVTITVTPQNDDPVALNESASTAEDTPIVINATANDSDVDGDTLSIQGTPVATNGTISAVSGGNYTFTPALGFSGTATVTYVVTDPSGATDTATTTITVTSVLDAPDSADKTITITEDAAYTIQTADIAFTDQDGDVLQSIRFEAPSTGTLLVGGVPVTNFPVTVTAAQLNADQISYLPPQDGFGPGLATLDFTVNDGQLDDLAANRLTFDVTAVNDPIVPTGAGLPDVTHQDGETGISLPTSGAFDDVDNSITSYSASVWDTNGNAVTLAALGLQIDSNTGLITSVAGGLDHLASNGSGYTISVTATSADTTSETESFVLTITNPAPTVVQALNDFDTTNGTGINLDASVAFDDADGDQAGGTRDDLTYSMTGGPSTLTIDPATGVITGTVSDIADEGYAVFVTVTDEQGAAATEGFVINLLNSAPDVLQAIPGQTLTDAVAMTPITLDDYFNDVDGDGLIYSATGLPDGLSLVNGQIVGTPEKDDSQQGPANNGIYEVTIRAQDNSGAEAVQAVAFTVVNPAPTVAQTPSLLTMQDSTTRSVALAPLFTDPDDDTLTYSSVAVGASPGALVVTTNGAGDPVLRITADSSASQTQGGSYTVAITVDDGHGGTETVLQEITVTNPAPTVDTPLPPQTNEDAEGVSLSLADLFTDIDGDTLTLSDTGLPPGLSLTGTTISGTLDGAASAGSPYAVQITATDADGASTTYDFDWSVTNPVPEANPIAPQTGQDGAPLSITLTGIFSDPDGDALTYQVVSDHSALGSVSIAPNGSGVPVITAAPDADASQGGLASDGVYTLTVTATDADGDAVSETVQVTIENPAPIATGLPDQTADDLDTIALDLATLGGFADGGTDSDTLTFSTPSTLPPGLSLSTTGQLSGTLDHLASAGSPYAITIEARDGQGGIASESFIFTVENPAPEGTSLTDQIASNTVLFTFATGSAFSDADGDVAGGTSDDLTFSANGLPAALTIDPDTGVISGTPGAAVGRYPITVTVTDEQGASATLGFNLDLSNTPPFATATIPDQAYDDTDTITAIDLSGVFTDPDTQSLTLTLSGPNGAAALPATLTFDGTQITGTLDASDSQGGPNGDGIYPITVTATDPYNESTTQSFILTVTNPAPTAGTLDDQTIDDGDGLSLNIADLGGFADDDTLSYSASGLPSWLSLSADGTALTGTAPHDASASGPYPITITADDGEGGNVARVFNLIVLNTQPVADAALPDLPIIEATSQNIDVTTAFSDDDADPLTYTTTSTLPDGLTLDPNSGIISGTVGTRAADTPSYPITIIATDSEGASAEQSFTLTVTNPAPVGTSLPNWSFTDNANVTIPSAFAFSDDDTMVFQVGGLPVGLTIDDDTGIISGTLERDASQSSPYTITVLAEDEQGAQTEVSFQLTVTNIDPVSSALPNQTGNDLDEVSLDLATLGGFSDGGIDDDPLTFASVGEMPPGLSLSDAGVLSGTLDHLASAGSPFTVTVEASDGNGGTTQQSFTYTVANPEPEVATPLADVSITNGTAVSVATAGAFSDADGDPAGGTSDDLTFTAMGLPTGLSIDSGTGLISGTPAAAVGTYSITVTVTDEQGAVASDSFDLTVDNTLPVVAAPMGNQTYTDATTILALDLSGVFTDADPLNTGLTLSLAGAGGFSPALPAGLSFDGSQIAGTPAKNASQGGPLGDGVYPLVLTVTDGDGGQATYAFTLTIQNPAPIASALPDVTLNDADAANIAAGAVFSDPDGDVLTFSTASTLPAGLSLDPDTGAITGTVGIAASQAQGGSYPITVTATDADGASVDQSFTLTIQNPVPIASALPDVTLNDAETANIAAGAAFSDPDGDVLTFSTASTLPAGLSLDPDTGAITGTVGIAASQAQGGSYPITVTATDADGASVNQSFTLTIQNPVPIVSALPDVTLNDAETANIAAGAAFSDPDGDVLTFSTASTLPAGLSLDPDTGAITGTVGIAASQAQGGSYPITVTATDADGASVNQSFTLTIQNPAPIASALPDVTLNDAETANIAAGAAFSDPDGDVLTFSTASTLPAGLSLDPDTGAITGTVGIAASQAQGGSYPITVTATDADGASVNQSFTLTIQNPVPIVSALPDVTLNDAETANIAAGAAFSDPDGDVLTFSTASTLPAGLSLDPDTGAITGTVGIAASQAQGGSYPITVTATDADGASVNQSFTLTIQNPAPIASALPDVTLNDAETANIAAGAAFSDPDGDVLTFSTASTLPAGLSLDPDTGAITGTVGIAASQAQGGSYPITVTATDADGASVNQSFTLTIQNPAPIASALPDVTLNDAETANIAAGAAFSDPDGDVLTFSTASTLPAGLSLDPDTGAITGTVGIAASQAQGGSYPITVTATDADGASVNQSFTLTIQNPAPIVSALPDVTLNDAETANIAAGAAFSDPDGDVLTFSTASTLPTGLSLDPDTGAITGTVGIAASQAQGGSYPITVTATDADGASVDQSFTLTIQNPVPIASALPDLTFAGADEVTINVAQAFDDPDGDQRTYQVTGLPVGLSFDPLTGQITGIVPEPASLSDSYAITVVVTDADGATGQTGFTLSLQPEGQPASPAMVETPQLASGKQRDVPEPLPSQTLQLIALEALDPLSSSATLEANTPILNAIEAFQNEARDQASLRGPNFSNTFPISMAVAHDNQGESGLVSNVLIGDDRVLYLVEALDGRAVQIVDAQLPPGVLTTADGAILLERWVSVPFDVTVTLRNGDQIETLTLQVHPSRHQMEVHARALRGLLLEERLNWAPSLY